MRLWKEHNRRAFDRVIILPVLLAIVSVCIMVGHKPEYWRRQLPVEVVLVLPLFQVELLKHMETLNLSWIEEFPFYLRHLIFILRNQRRVHHAKFSVSIIAITSYIDCWFGIFGVENEFVTSKINVWLFDINARAQQRLIVLQLVKMLPHIVNWVMRPKGQGKSIKTSRDKLLMFNRLFIECILHWAKKLNNIRYLESWVCLLWFARLRIVFLFFVKVIVIILVLFVFDGRWIGVLDIKTVMHLKGEGGVAHMEQLRVTFVYSNSLDKSGEKAEEALQRDDSDIVWGSGLILNEDRRGCSDVVDLKVV